jgi:hypothetical protein
LWDRDRDGGKQVRWVVGDTDRVAGGGGELVQFGSSRPRVLDRWWW